MLSTDAFHGYFPILQVLEEYIRKIITFMYKKINDFCLPPIQVVKELEDGPPQAHSPRTQEHAYKKETQSDCIFWLSYFISFQKNVFFGSIF